MNKMIGSAVCVTAALILLSGCRSKVTQNEDQVREVSSFSNLCNNGELYMDNDKTVFCDFISMTAAPLCSKPNCPHNNEKICSAYNMYGVPFLYNEKIYYFVSDAIDNGDKTFSDITDVYISDTDGTNRSVVKTIKDLCPEEGSNMFIVGNELYLFAVKHNFSEYGGYGSEQTKEVRFCKFDLTDYSLTDIALLGTDYSNSSYFLGVFNGSIYFNYSYLEEPDVDFENTDYKHKEYKYDLKSGEISDNDVDNLHMISGGWIIIKNGSGCIMRNEKGEEITLEENYSDFDCIVNDIAFSGYYGYCVDLKSGKKYSLDFGGENSQNSRYTVKDHIDVRYIVGVQNYAENSREYISFTEDELIGEEIK
ncbi:MAG: hypothetical protein HDT44_12085 [Ruminococcaceae bacterium]|nr:hypothetical protein [Oscillospiraceae bacterium]